MDFYKGGEQVVNYDTEYGIGYDSTFELNEFSQPRISSEIEVIKNVVLYVLFSKPGQYPSLPHLGMDVQSLLYSFYDEIDENDLKDQMITQCNALGVYFDQGTVEFKKIKYQGKPSLLIHIEGNENYPPGYMKDSIDNANRYLIGITFDELNKMVYNISTEGGS